jgi:hypothetical protein
LVDKNDPARKGPHRTGPFKHAFANDAVLVYATGGSVAENDWALAKARYDAETFKYRGNGAFDVMSDLEFVRSSSSSGSSAARFRADRNIILYGNADTNVAWELTLASDPFRVDRQGVRIGSKTHTGDDLGVIALRPRLDSDTALVGVVGGTTLAGCRATDRLPYFVSGVAFPDYTVITPEIYESGIDAVIDAGYFDGAWRADSE